MRPGSQRRGTNNKACKIRAGKRDKRARGLPEPRGHLARPHHKPARNTRFGAYILSPSIKNPLKG